MTIERIDLYWMGLRKKVTEIIPKKNIIIAASATDPEEHTLVKVVSPDEINVVYKPEKAHEFHKKSSLVPHEIMDDNSIFYKEDAINHADGFGRPLFVLQQGTEKISWLDSTLHWRPTEEKK
jgi:hypothetical protein